MTHRQLKLGYFALEGINAFATAYYFNYLFFYMHREFGFSNLDNLLLSALNGFVYMGTAWYGGRFGQKQGYFAALSLGFGLMAGAMISGCFLDSLPGQFTAMIVWTLGMCFTWPNLEALASEDEPREGLTQMVGIYNVVWASGTAVAFFIGGALIEQLGWKSMFWLPAGLHLGQLILVLGLQQKSAAIHAAARTAEMEVGTSASAAPEIPAVQQAEAKRFLRMAWFANPFAYPRLIYNFGPPLARAMRWRMPLTEGERIFSRKVAVDLRVAPGHPLLALDLDSYTDLRRASAIQFGVKGKHRSLEVDFKQYIKDLRRKNRRRRRDAVG